jgi:serine/threonine protein kinase
LYISAVMENYSRVKLLGQGAFGTAYLCKHKVDGKQYVVKEIDTTKMSRPEKDAAEQEAKVSSRASGPAADCVLGWQHTAFAWNKVAQL